MQPLDDSSQCPLYRGSFFVPMPLGLMSAFWKLDSLGGLGGITARTALKIWRSGKTSRRAAIILDKRLSVATRLKLRLGFGCKKREPVSVRCRAVLAPNSAA